MTIILGLALLLLIGFAVLIYKFSNFVLRIQVHPYEQSFRQEQNKGPLDLEALERLPKEELRIRSRYGYELSGWFIPAPGAARTVIIVHGVTLSRAGSVKYMDLYRKRGFNVLMYDQRRHGLSGGTHTTYGYYERHDLQTVIDWVDQRCGPGHAIGVHGESMGAATALLHAAMNDRVAFYVADCPYSDFAKQLAYRLKVEYKLPPFPFIPLVAWVCKIRSGMRLNDVAPIQGIAGVETPVFFIHGGRDTYVPTEMSIAMHRVKPGLKKLYLAPQAEHAQSFWSDPDQYDRLLGEFLEECGVMQGSERSGREFHETLSR